jgi:hypothetical protein
MCAVGNVRLEPLIRSFADELQASFDHGPNQVKVVLMGHRRAVLSVTVSGIRPLLAELVKQFYKGGVYVPEASPSVNPSGDRPVRL